MAETERFDPRKHLMDLKGKKYLPVAPRIVAFREECPVAEGWSIRTQRLEGGRADGYALYKATITDPNGRIVSEGSKQEDKAGFADFEEKAETGAIGRALASAGYGTLYAIEFDEGADVCDAPQPSKKTTAPARPAATAPAAPAAEPPSVRVEGKAAWQAPTTSACAICKDASKPIPPGRVANCNARGMQPTHFECGDLKREG